MVENSVGSPTGGVTDSTVFYFQWSNCKIAKTNTSDWSHEERSCYFRCVFQIAVVLALAIAGQGDTMASSDRCRFVTARHLFSWSPSLVWRLGRVAAWELLLLEDIVMQSWFSSIGTRSWMWHRTALPRASLSCCLSYRSQTCHRRSWSSKLKSTQPYQK